MRISYHQEMMEVKYLDTFFLLAKELNYTKAGKALGLTQAAVSRQIIYLEKTLGQQLFLRSPKQVQLTPFGQELLNQSRPLFEYLEKIKNGDTPAKLRIGSIRGLAEYYLIDRLLDIKEVASVGPTIYIDFPEVLLSHLTNGELDAIFTNKNFQSTLYSSRPVFKEKLVFIRMGAIDLKKLHSYPWAVYGNDDMLFQISPKQSSLIFSANSYQVMLKIVEKQNALAIIPAHRLEPGHPFTVMPLKGHEADPIYMTVPNLEKWPPLLKKILTELS